MSKQHKIPADRLVRIPLYLTPMPPARGQFVQFVTQAPPDLWNVPTLEAVVRHSCDPAARESAGDELARRRNEVKP